MRTGQIRLPRTAGFISRPSGLGRPPPFRPYATNTPSTAGRWTLAATAGLAAVLGSLIGNYITDSNPSFQSKDGQTHEFGKFGSPDDFEQAIAQLRQDLSEDQISTAQDVLHVHGFSDNSWVPGMTHSVVVYPGSTEDVVKIMKVATKYRMPVVPYSGGTSLEGHFAGIKGGCICVDLSNMNQILEIHEADSDAVVQPGLGWEDLNAALKDKGIPLFFPIDPGPGAKIGGMISTGCSGTNAVKYGTAKSHWFLNITVVLPSGEVIKTRSRARKSSAGFDLTKLFIGAEGTLGIVTEATVRLTPLVPTSVAVAAFPDVQKAVQAVEEALRSTAGDSIQCIELVDDNFMVATNRLGQSQRKYLEKDSLFFKLQGSASSIAANAKIIGAIVKKHGGLNFELARSEQEASDLWRDRKNALWTSLATIPGSKGWSTDVCVPVSRLPELVYATKEDLKQIGIPSTIVGHVGDGNFHALLLFTDDAQLPVVEGAVHRMVERALALEGTCTGEHGVGIGKKEYLYKELGEGTVNLMKQIKRNIDPSGIMNPGKLYPDELKNGLSGIDKHT